MTLNDPAATPSVHPTALVEPGAQLGAGVKIGPYCIIGGSVVLGEGVELKSHVVIEGSTTIGARTQVYPFTTLGGPPQHLRYDGEDTALIIGADCIIREQVSIHKGTALGGGKTELGNHCLVMAASWRPLCARSVS